MRARVSTLRPVSQIVSDLQGSNDGRIVPAKCTVRLTIIIVPCSAHPRSVDPPLWIGNQRAINIVTLHGSGRYAIDNDQQKN